MWATITFSMFATINLKDKLPPSALKLAKKTPCPFVGILGIWLAPFNTAKKFVL
jgi:hypothetical protein